MIAAENLSHKIGEEIRMPRVTRVQVYRENYESRSSEEYYRKSVFIPFVEHFKNQLEKRFLKHKQVLSKIQNIIPKKIVKLNEIEIHDTCDAISAQWPDVSNDYAYVYKSEMMLWKLKWLEVDEKPRTFIDALRMCDDTMFPNVYIFLKIGASLPITVSSIEHSFSTLKRIKTYLRNSTEEARLNGLAHMSIHRDIPLKIDQIIDRLAQKNRRILL